MRVLYVDEKTLLMKVNKKTNASWSKIRVTGIKRYKVHSMYNNTFEVNVTLRIITRDDKDNHD